MRKVLGLIFCSILLAVSVPAVYSQEAEVAVSEEAVVSEEVAVSEVSGKIVSIDLNSSSLVISPESASKDETAVSDNMTIQITSVTTIQKDSKNIMLADLQTDGKVTIKYTVNENAENIAKEIIVK